MIPASALNLFTLFIGRSLPYSITANASYGSYLASVFSG